MDTTKRNGQPDRVADISPDGDVVLVVGAENVRLRVQSQCLRSASKVFGKMFGPDWSEGQRLLKEAPTEIPLPEDDADAMRTVCHIIHHRNDLVPPHLSAEEVLRIAIEVDKYDLKVAFKYANVGWLKPRINAERVDMGYLLVAAYLFDNTDAFMAHALTLILHYNGSYLNFLDDELISEIISSRIFCLLEERRTRFRAGLCELLTSGKRDACECGWGKYRNEKYERILAEYTPMKMLNASIADIIAKIEGVSTENMGKSTLCLRSRKDHEPLPYSQTFLGTLETLRKESRISIDDVRSFRVPEM
ncbi:hypothetical protein IQ07DRAFT_646412 [Pyrenochaeta sp. DS3sAY3a]|nr:hypothetical protein IQ07DRAFT_646412 [Pyrenochaeta sp. DS3sAY3a]